MIDLKQLDRLDFAGKRVTVVGLGIEGVDIARYLARRRARVTISDSKPADRLSEQLAEVAGLPLDLSLGGGQDDAITQAEAVFVSQSVPLDLPALRKARENGVPLFSMVGYYLDVCPGPVAGITGSSGKTTTTALVKEMLQADERPVLVGGNIGLGLLDRLDCVRPYTWSVLEISHTQLQLVDRSPHVAAVLNITPNHLDKFDWETYKALKANLIRYQGEDDIAVLGLDDPEARALEPMVAGRLLWFTMGDSLPQSAGTQAAGRKAREAEGVFVRDGWAISRLAGVEQKLFRLADVPLRGRHNQENAVGAAAIAFACGVSPEAIACAVEAFRGVPHRLEFVAELDGAAYYNDSIATTPERTVAGLRSFGEPVVLLLGGRDKNLPMEELADEAVARSRGIVIFGESGDKIEAALAAAQARRKPPVVRVDTLEEAVGAARGLAQPGDVVLLSPACTSYDAYDNFEKRGEHFRSLVARLNAEVQPSLR